MSTTPTLGNPTSVSSAAQGLRISRVFELSLFALVLVGFLALVGTGKLDIFSLIFVSAALLYRGYQLAVRRTTQLSTAITDKLTLFYFAFYLLDFFLLSGSFVTATVHLILFIMVAKLFSVQRDRDHVYLAVISFLMLLATAILTVDTFFLAAFGVFLLLATITFITMEMGRSFRASTNVAAARSPQLQARMPRSLALGALGMVVFIALAGSVIFFILPRFSSGYLSAFAPRNEFVTGFSNDVQLGAIGAIQQSNEVVMHVRFQPGSPVPPELKFRGVALNQFDGHQWTNRGDDSFRRSENDGTLRLIPPELLLHQPPARVTSYEVLMEPVGANVFFLIPQPLQLNTHDVRNFSVDRSGSVVPFDATQQIKRYSALSRLSRVPAAARLTTPGSGPLVPAVYMQLPPELDPRIPALARQVTASATSSYDKATAIQDYLKAKYTYTLQMYTVPGGDPLAYFLFDRKSGHCEYFASSMAVMLRTIDIPSRVVNGFRNGEYNDLTGSYIVRARDAHSWVEAFIPGYGWATFDPTPGALLEGYPHVSRVALYLDAAREFWREWIINYDFSHQETLTRTAVSRTRTSARRTQLWLRRQYQQMLARLRRLVSGAHQPSPTSRKKIFALLVAVLLLLNLRRILRALAEARLSRRPQARPQAAASLWYLRLLKLLGRRGITHPPSQTTAELSSAITSPIVRKKVEKFAAAYEHARFGDSADSATRLPELYEEVEEALKK